MPHEVMMDGGHKNSAEDVPTCTHCGAPVEPHAQARRGTRRFCEACRTPRIYAIYQSRAYRQRQKERSKVKKRGPQSATRKNARIRYWRYRKGQKVICPHGHRDGFILPCEPYTVRCRAYRYLQHRLYMRRKREGANNAQTV